MKFKLKKLPISIIFGVLVIVTFCIFFLISVSLLPFFINPFNNWMSDLGNSSMNPNGALFFNLGCIITGLLLFPYYFGLYKWYLDKKWHKLLIIVVQFAGCCSAFALIMLGAFSEDIMDIHLFWSSLYFIFNMFVLIFSTFSLLKHPHFIKSIGIYGVIITIIDIFFVLIITIPPPPNPDPEITRVIMMMLKFLEWFTVFTSLGYVGLIIRNMYKINVKENSI